MGGGNNLACPLLVTKDAHNVLIDKTVVQVVFGLVNNEQPFRLYQEKQKHRSCPLTVREFFERHL